VALSGNPPPAFYASGSGGWRDWWTLLHPPYTLWNLSYVAIGSALAPSFTLWRLIEMLTAFSLGLGISAHALDELKGRPLRTHLSDRTLKIASAVGLVGAVVLGLKGIGEAGPWLVPFIVFGVGSVLAYNLEWFGGRFHTDVSFAVSWGAFPVLVGYFVEEERLSLAAGLVAVGAFGLSLAQRILSTETRFLRRRVQRARVELELASGEVRDLDRLALASPFDRALKTMSWALAALAMGMVVSRMAR
jgi:hypothetical protein